MLFRSAESHAGEDVQRREKIEKKNQLDSMIYQAEKMLTDNADKLSDSDKEPVQSAIASAKEDLESDDSARLDSGRQRLESELHKVAEALYKADASAGDPAAGAAEEEPGPSKSDDDVIDAEYTEEKGDS